MIFFNYEKGKRKVTQKLGYLEKKLQTYQSTHMIIPGESWNLWTAKEIKFMNMIVVYIEKISWIYRHIL